MSHTSPSEARVGHEGLGPDAVGRGKAGRARKVRTLLVGIVAVGVVAWGIHFALYLFTHETTDNAYVTGKVHTISSRLTGVVQEVLVEENSDVSKGQPLVKLDARDLELRCEQARVSIVAAQAQLAQAEAKLAEGEAEAKLAEAQVTQASAQVAREEASATRANADLQRAGRLFEQRGSGLISRSDFDAAKASSQTAVAGADAARAAVAAALAALESARAKLSSARAARDAAQAQGRLAETNLKDAELQLSYATITAPVAGRINRRTLEVGDHIQAGQAIFALVEPAVWIEANFKETQLSRIRPGQPVEITVDALPGRKFRGVVESFSPATGARFALLPPDNATGNFTKVVQRVPVRIGFEAASTAGVEEQIRPGLSTVVSVRTSP